MKFLNTVIVIFCLISINVLLSNCADTQRYHGPGSFKRDPCGCDAYLFYDPVCASNGRTYNNRMVLECERRCEKLNIYEMHRGECQEQLNFGPPKNRDSFKPVPCNCISRYEYDPVCGEDGRTYENFDQLDCYNDCDGYKIYVLHRGECRERPNSNPTRAPDAVRSRPCDCAPTGDYNPICGSDGKTYSNPDELACWNRCDNLDIRRLYRGECREQSSHGSLEYLPPLGQGPCDCGTSYESKPVCGSDGLTYENFSDLKCASKCRDANLYMLHKGECPNDPVPSPVRYSPSG